MKKRKDPYPKAIIAGSMRRDLRGLRFGRLKVSHFACLTPKWRKTMWCCTCECGGSIRVDGTDLMTGRTVSCGCARADPQIRRAARMKVPVKRRKQIAQLAANACKGKPSEAQPRYKLRIERAAEFMGVSEERVRVLCDTGVLRWRIKDQETWVSATDVNAWMVQDMRERKRCPQEERGNSPA